MARLIFAALLVAACSSSKSATPVTDGGNDATDATDALSCKPARAGACTQTVAAACASAGSLSCTAKWSDPFVAPADWCKRANGGGVTASQNTCCGMHLVSFGEGVDVGHRFYFDESGTLIGYVSDVSRSLTCAGGAPGFVVPDDDACLWRFGPNLCTHPDAGSD